MLARDTDPITTARSRLDYHATVRELPSQERPRERLQHFGPQALSAVELLAIILRPARAGITPWTWLTACSSSMAVWPGWCGPTSTNYALSAVWARSAQIKAALELGRRLALLSEDTRYRISTPSDAANLVMLELAYLDSEQMRVLLLDAKGQLLEKVNLYQGTANSTALRACEVFRPAVIRNCPALILCHNHRRKSTFPSQRRPHALRGGPRDNAAAGGGRAHPGHRVGGPPHHRPAALRQPQGTPEVGVTDCITYVGLRRPKHIRTTVSMPRTAGLRSLHGRRWAL